jgi:hypothetical protein
MPIKEIDMQINVNGYDALHVNILQLYGVDTTKLYEARHYSVERTGTGVMVTLPKKDRTFQKHIETFKRNMRFSESFCNTLTKFRQEGYKKVFFSPDGMRYSDLTR